MTINNNFEKQMKNLVDTMIELKVDNRLIEETIIDVLRKDIEDKHTKFLLDLLNDFYRNTDWEI